MSDIGKIEEPDKKELVQEMVRLSEMQDPNIENLFNDLFECIQAVKGKHEQ